MDLLDIVRRQVPPEPWAEGEKIPWDDADFSRRMLQEHLSQEHDSASRRAVTIDRHVAWIHQVVLSGKPARILDLGCGPGLYTSRLAALGHTCVGIDFAPASIAYAREQARREGLACRYVQGDIRSVDYGTDYGLAMLIFGEFNVFRPSDASDILRKVHAALAAGGLILLEPHTFATVCQQGGETWWHASASGLFSDRPHITFYESFWDRAHRTTTERYFVIDAATGEVTRHAATLQAYTDGDYATLLSACGYRDVAFYASLGGEKDEAQRDFMVLVATKA